MTDKRPSFSGDTASPTPKPALANSDVMPLRADAALELTTDQRATVVTALFVPTVQRMCTLISTVVQTGQNADMALWLPLAAMDATLRDLKWGDASTETGLRFLELCVKTLREYADRLNAHMLLLSQWEGEGRVGPRPAIPAWQNEDTLRLYDEVEAARPVPPVNRTVLRDTLLLVIDETGLPGSELDVDRATNEELAVADAALMTIINGWTDDECRAVQAWASAVHLKASDNPDVVVPPMPQCVTPPRTIKEPGAVSS